MSCFRKGNNTNNFLPKCLFAKMISCVLTGGPLLVLFIFAFHIISFVSIFWKKRPRLGRLQTKLGVSDDAFLICPQVKDLPGFLTTGWVQEVPRMGRIFVHKNGPPSCRGYKKNILYIYIQYICIIYYVYYIYLSLSFIAPVCSSKPLVPVISRRRIPTGVPNKSLEELMEDMMDFRRIPP